MDELTRINMMQSEIDELNEKIRVQHMLIESAQMRANLIMEINDELKLKENNHVDLLKDAVALMEKAFDYDGDVFGVLHNNAVDFLSNCNTAIIASDAIVNIIGDT